MPEQNNHINVERQVMEKIKKGEVTMRPKIYFVCGSLVLFLGVAATTVFAIFFTNITLFALRAIGPFDSMRLAFLWSVFPWWAPVIGILGIALGIILLKQYDFSYKRSPLWIVLGFLIVVFLFGWMMSRSVLNQRLYMRGPQFMRRVDHERMMEEGFRRFPIRGFQFLESTSAPFLMPHPGPFIPGR